MDNIRVINDNSHYTELAKDLRAIACERKQSAAVALIDRAVGEFSKNTFSLAVLGMVKRGKSTFCNALLGADSDKFAPVGKCPVSNAITVFENGEESVCVEFQDGHSENASIEDIPRFVTEEDNSGNKKGVSCLKVKSPFPRLPDGVVLVDTPGEGSFHIHHDDILYKYLPSVDAAVFQKPCQCLVSDSVRAHDFSRDDLAVLYFINLEILCPSEMLKDVSVVVSYCNSHYVLLPLCSII